MNFKNEREMKRGKRDGKREGKRVRCRPGWPGPLNGGRAHYIIESKVQWKPFWLATQQYSQNDWLGGNFPCTCRSTMTYAHGAISADGGGGISKSSFRYREVYIVCRSTNSRGWWGSKSWQACVGGGSRCDLA